jgi:C-terminal processing protease CtpA/Prc
MKIKPIYLILILISLSMMTTACLSFSIGKDRPQNPTLDPELIEDGVQGPLVLRGEFEYTNDFYPEEYAYEHAVALLDMSGFVLRDEEWRIPVESQVLGYLEMDLEANSGIYWLRLPIRPAGMQNDVDNNKDMDPGVQIFAVEYSPNWTGGPFYTGDDYLEGWPGYLASVTVDRENHNEVTGGKLVVWSPNDEQSFSTGFGDDDLLFTDDDPTGPLPTGYSVIDLDQQPFEIIRDSEPVIALYEPEDAAIKDFSDLSYSEAFKNMFDIISREYAFNGIENKTPDWDALYDELAPRVQQAEEEKDPEIFFLAMRDLELAFKDGHVGLDGGDVGLEYIRGQILGGYGFSIREVDDGSVYVVYMLPGGPADIAGIKLGAQILEVNGEPVSEAIGNVTPFSPQSTDFGLRYEQGIFLLHDTIGSKISIMYANPGGSTETIQLEAIYEVESLYATWIWGMYDENRLPVEASILPSGVGYVRMNSNSDDLNLTYRLFERALRTFEDNETIGVIIDMRLDLGGAPLGLAGYLTDEEITLGQLAYYSDKTGEFEPEGPPDTFTPMEKQYSFDHVVLLVDQFCFSACEIESYGFSQVPGITVMGQYPTAGVEAETARGNFDLPEEMSFHIPTGRYTLPDDSIFLEGVGVQPTIRIPITRESVLSQDDLVLLEAETFILEQ